MSREEETLENLKTNLANLKYKYERQEALEKLSEIDVNFDQLVTTKAGAKLSEIFRSSRFEQQAKVLHQKWLELFEKELKEHWEEHKHQFLSKEQIAQLDRAQNRYNKKHGIVTPAAIAKKTPQARPANPYQKVYQRFTAPVPLHLGGPSTSASDTPLPSPYGAASTPLDPDSNFVAYNYSTVAIKRPRGRPRTNFSVKGESGRKRGRPPVKRR